MRTFNSRPVEIEFPGRYFLDEARFCGGHEHLRNEKEEFHGTHAHFQR